MRDTREMEPKMPLLLYAVKTVTSMAHCSLAQLNYAATPLLLRSGLPESNRGQLDKISMRS